jgi:flavorubredoxin
MTTTITPTVPLTDPVAIGPDTFLITNLAPAGDAYVPVNSLVIRGAEPIVVDTGAPVHRARWLEQVFGLVDPEDIRWVFLSHEDGDHTGSLQDVLIAARNATLVQNAFGAERLALERTVPVHRSIWREPGEVFDAGDRRIRLFLPPIFDGPATRGLLDERTGTMWAVDAFGALTPGPVHHVDELPTDLYDETFTELNSLVSPWHQWLDVDRYRQHVDHIETLHPASIASAHGPILTGSAIPDAFDRIRRLAGQPRHVPASQSALDQLLADAH